MTTEVYHSKQPQEAHYDPETGDYDGQLPNPDLVAQLAPPTPEHLRPIPDNTVKTLFYWAMDLDITQGARMVLLAVIRHVEWADCTGCTASIPTLAREAHLSERSTKGHIKALISDGLISRKRRMNRTCTTDLITEAPPLIGEEVAPLIGEEVAPPIGEAASPTGGRSGFTFNQSSSSTNPDNQSNNRKMSKSKKPETEKKKPQEEEKKTETTKESPPPGGTAPMAHAEDVDAWLEANMPASPMISFAEAMLRHYKKLKLWWQPDVSDGWHCRTKIATAAKYYINNPDTWHQLRDDLRDKILRGGLPPDVEYHDSKPKLKVPLRCDTCQTVSITYQEEQKLQYLEETFVDKCDVCLSRQPVEV